MTDCADAHFSVVMYYHFAFLASPSRSSLERQRRVAYVWRARLDRSDRRSARATGNRVRDRHFVALFALVRLRVGLTYSPSNLG